MPESPQHTGVTPLEALETLVASITTSTKAHHEWAMTGYDKHAVAANRARRASIEALEVARKTIEEARKEATS